MTQSSKLSRLQTLVSQNLRTETDREAYAFAQLAGIEIHPAVFKSLLSLLNQGIAPKTLIEVLYQLLAPQTDSQC